MAREDKSASHYFGCSCKMCEAEIKELYKIPEKWSFSALKCGLENHHYHNSYPEPERKYARKYGKAAMKEVRRLYKADKERKEDATNSIKYAKRISK